VGARPILHTAVAASLAWLAATELLGHEQPFFAPIAAVITLGLTVGQRRRRAVEMAVGVALGILVADLIVFVIGSGTWQIAVVTALAMGAAILFGGGTLLVSQATTSAVLVATLQPPDDGVSLARFLDALTGGGIALAVATLLFPVDPVLVMRRAAGPVLHGLAVAIDTVADGLERRDPDAAERALVRARGVSLIELREALVAAGDSIRLSPRPGRAQARMRRYETMADHLGLAVNNVRVVARGAARAIALGDATPPDLIVALRALARSARALGADELEAAREAAADAASEANAVMEQTGNMSALHIVGQLRSTAVDLLRAAGMEHADAADVVRGGAVHGPG